MSTTENKEPTVYAPAQGDMDKLNKVWERYRQLRDNGHKDYVEKADECSNFFWGKQWDEATIQRLKSEGRPYLTMNKIMRTVKQIVAQHINNRAEITYLPLNEGVDEIATALSKVFKYISRDNQLDWLVQQMVMAGLTTGRAFLDVRVEFDDSMTGSVRITKLNAKNVMIECDGTEYDPDNWNDVIVTKWLTVDEIEASYGKDKADYLRNGGNMAPYGTDQITNGARERFGNDRETIYTTGATGERKGRFIRVVEHQHKKLETLRYFVNLRTGDLERVPPNWDKAKEQQHLAANPGHAVVQKPGKRIRWSVVADNVLLHDDWSPYEHFTVVPYFPVFDEGRSSGVVEHLIGSQNLLNKTTSQELHVVNTTANSGWVVKSGSLVNMDITELEDRGAQTGLVLEVSEDVTAAVQKIQPNQFPSGLDRLAQKGDEAIKEISNVNDSMLGQDREDVAAKAIMAKQQVGQQTFALEFDNYSRTMTILARNVLDLIQAYYTEPRLIPVIADEFTQRTEFMQVNQPQAVESIDDPEQAAEIINNLSLGRYTAAVSIVPSRELMEDSEFEQAVRLRELGVQIDDAVLIKNSRLRDRGEIIKQLEAAANDPTNQQIKALQLENLQLENEKLKAEIGKANADTMHKEAKADGEQAKIVQNAAKLDSELEQAEKDNPAEALQIKREEAAMKIQGEREKLGMKREEHAMKLNQQAEKHDLEMVTSQNRADQEAMRSEVTFQQNVTHAEETHKKNLERSDEAAKKKQDAPKADK